MKRFLKHSLVFAAVLLFAGNAGAVITMFTLTNDYPVGYIGALYNTNGSGFDFTNTQPVGVTSNVVFSGGGVWEGIAIKATNSYGLAKFTAFSSLGTNAASVSQCFSNSFTAMASGITLNTNGSGSILGGNTLTTNTTGTAVNGGTLTTNDSGSVVSGGMLNTNGSGTTLGGDVLNTNSSGTVVSGGSNTTNTPSINTNSVAASTNGPSLVLIPVAILAGTNSPEGVINASYGSVYNQFQPDGTNFIEQWIKTTRTGTTGWLESGGGGSLTGSQLSTLANAVTNNDSRALTLNSATVANAKQLQDQLGNAFVTADPLGRGYIYNPATSNQVAAFNSFQTNWYGNFIGTFNGGTIAGTTNVATTNSADLVFTGNGSPTNPITASFSPAQSNLLANAVQAGATNANDIWLSPNPVNTNGDGSLARPICLTNAAQWDAFWNVPNNLWPPWPTDPPPNPRIPYNTTIHLLAGTFHATNGVTMLNGWKIIGAGKDSTIVKYDTSPNGSDYVFGGRTAYLPNGITNCAVENLTIDLNLQSQTNHCKPGAVCLTGDNALIKGVKVVNWGTTLVGGGEEFILSIENQGGDFYDLFETNIIHNAKIQDCEIGDPANVFMSNGVTAISIFGFGMFDNSYNTDTNSFTSVTNGWVVGADISGNTIKGPIYVQSSPSIPGIPTYFHASSIPSCIQGIRIHDNIFQNLTANYPDGAIGTYSESGTWRDATVENNQYLNVDMGFYKRPTSSWKQSGLAIRNNTILFSSTNSACCGIAAYGYSSSNMLQNVVISGNRIVSLVASNSPVIPTGIYVQWTTNLAVFNNFVDAGGGIEFDARSSNNIVSYLSNWNKFGTNLIQNATAIFQNSKPWSNLSGTNITSGTVPTNAIDSTFRSWVLAQAGGGGTNSIAVTPNLLEGDNAGGAIDSGIAGTNVALMNANNDFTGSNHFATLTADSIFSPDFSVSNLFLPFASAIPYVNGTSNMVPLSLSSALTLSSGTLSITPNTFDAYGSALAATNGYPWQTNSIITGATFLGTNSFDDPATSDGPIKVSQNIDTLNFWSPFGNNMNFVDVAGNGWEENIWKVHANNFYGDGTYLTNAPITLGGSSITSSNGATATMMLGVDGSGKATTNAINFQTTSSFQSFTNGLTIGAFTNAPVSTAGTTNLIAGWMLIYTNPATSEQRWVPYITNHP